MMEGIDVIVGERPAQAYLLVGEGTAEAARALVRRIICKDGAGCAKLERGVHPDVRWVEKGKRAIGIDQIRGLQEDALYPPSEAEHKVYIIAETEALSLEAANSLLRILEETPPYLIFILLARGLDLLPTIISRCRLIRLTPQAPAIVREELRSRGFGEEETDYLLAVTKGQPQLLAELPQDLHPLEERAEVRERLKGLGDRELVRLLAKATSPIEFHEVALELVGRIPRLNSYHVLNIAAALGRLPREAIKALFREAVYWFRDLLVLEVAPSKGLPSWVGGGYDPLRLLELIPMLERTRSELEGNANLQLLLEVSLLRMREAAG